MKSFQEELDEAVEAALTAVLGGGDLPEPGVRPAADPRFGDYQTSAALQLKGRTGRPPREIAEQIAAALRLPEGYAPPEVAGPGFLNFRLTPGLLAARLASIQDDPRLGVPRASRPERVVVDFSSPNLAKEMHVGHLRSTIIGDAIARLLEFQGHDVLRLNHIGDWGTQFGMLIQHVRETHPEALERPEEFHLDDLEEFYRAAKARFDREPDFKERARRAVVDLQAGDPVATRVWEVFCRESLRHAREILDRLGVRIVDRGESFYNEMLPGIVEELLASGVASVDEGAVCVFLEGWTNREGTPLPLIVRKSDGGYNYDTTDLAGIRHRVETELASRLIYVTDIRQRQHFEMVFAAARKVGWVPGSVSLEHVGFGMVLGEDRKPFKTRSGGTIKLKELLDEAESRALQAAATAARERGDEEWWNGLDEAMRREIARVVGIGAVKYFDLSHNLTTDYVFDWDHMLALQGNTAPYLQYAYARIRSIGRRAGVDFDALPTVPALLLDHPAEVALARALLQFGPAVAQMGRELRPHLLTEYLYGLARAFSGFYDRERGVRVIDAAPEEVRLSRLRLCEMTARTLRLGLDLLGIEVLEQM